MHAAWNFLANLARWSHPITQPQTHAAHIKHQNSQIPGNVPGFTSSAGMGRLSGSPAKRTTRPQTTHSRSQDNSWFKALEILDENDSQYLVHWEGMDPSTGKEWGPSWVCFSVGNVAHEQEPKQNCSPGLVRSWKPKQKINGADRPLPTPTRLRNQALPGTMKPIPVDEAADCQLKPADPRLVYPPQPTLPWILPCLQDIHFGRQPHQ